MKVRSVDEIGPPIGKTPNESQLVKVFLAIPIINFFINAGIVLINVDSPSYGILPGRHYHRWLIC